MWCEAGFPPETFWQQTQRSFANALAGVAKSRVTTAWYVAALTASASVGKLPSLDSLLFPARANQAESAKLLSSLFKLKARGVPMTVERLH